MPLPTPIASASDADVRRILHNLLSAYMSPAFGSLPKREIDLIFLAALEDLGVIAEDPSIYDLVSKLRVTRSKARGLYYDRALRCLGQEDLDVKAMETLKHPILQKQGELFVFEIENPLVSDHIRHLFQEIGHATDGSFSPSLIKVSLDAYISLMEKRLSEEAKKQVTRALVKAGAPDQSFRGVVKAALIALGKAAANDAGAAIASKIPDYLGKLWAASATQISTAFQGVMHAGGNKC